MNRKLLTLAGGLLACLLTLLSWCIGPGLLRTRQIQADGKPAQEVIRKYHDAGWKLLYNRAYTGDIEVYECQERLGDSQILSKLAADISSGYSSIGVSLGGIAAASFNNNKIALKLRNGTVIVPAHRPRYAHLSSDARYVAYCSDDMLVVYSLERQSLLPLAEPIKLAQDSSSLSWHPSSAQLVCETVNADLLMLDPETGIRQSLGSGQAPSWSPDGTILAFIQNPTPHEEVSKCPVLLYDQGTKKISTVGLIEYSTGPLRWTPDARYIGFIGSNWPHYPWSIDPVARYPLRLLKVDDGSILCIPQCAFLSKHGPDDNWDCWWVRR